MLIVVFALFFLASSVTVEVVPLFAEKTEADIATTDHEDCVVLKPVFSTASRLRQLKGKMGVSVIDGHEGHRVYGHPAAGQIARASAFFPQEDLYKLQRVYRR